MSDAQQAHQLSSEDINDILAQLDSSFAVIEDALEELKLIPSEYLLQKLFREIHTLKDNASIFHLTDLIDATDALEHLISALIEGFICIEHSICEIILASMDRIRDLHYQQLGKASFGNLCLADIVEALRQLASARGAEAIQLLSQSAIKTLTHSTVADDAQALMLAGPMDAVPLERQGSIATFASIGEQIDRTYPNWQERGKLTNYWALRINDVADRPIDPAQLSAAMYMHDIGMPFLPAETLHKTSKYSPEELAELQQHPIWGFDLVRRMEGFEEAAVMIMQHHERVDGQGYPAGLANDKIHTGAKLIAILDAFFAMINTRADRQHRRSVLRAIAEINACSGSQFCPLWVQYFNVVMRDEVKNGLLQGKHG